MYIFCVYVRALTYFFTIKVYIYINISTDIPNIQYNTNISIFIKYKL